MHVGGNNGTSSVNIHSSTDTYLTVVYYPEPRSTMELAVLTFIAAQIHT